MLRDNDELSRTFQNMSLRGPPEQSARGCGAQSAGLAPPEASLLGVWTLSLPVSSRVCVSSLLLSEDTRPTGSGHAMASFYLNHLCIKDAVSPLLPPPEVLGVRASASGFGDMIHPMTETTEDEKHGSCKRRLEQNRNTGSSHRRGASKETGERTCPCPGQHQRPPAPVSRGRRRHCPGGDPLLSENRCPRSYPPWGARVSLDPQTGGVPDPSGRCRPGGGKRTKETEMQEAAVS